MKFNSKAQAKMAIRILQEVKINLPMKKVNIGFSDSRYICDNITQVKLDINTEFAYTTGTALRAWISRMLNPAFSLERWLEINYNTDKIKMSNKEYYEKIQVTRLAWLDWMIQTIKTENNL